jgi:glycosyltransferase involved in cell wall biosynthesis
MNARPLKIAYVSGPANIEIIYREWSEKKRQEYFGTDYMKQFLDVASDLKGESYVVTWHGDRPSLVRHGKFVFDNRPLTSQRGLRYHLGMVGWHLRVLPKLLHFRPDILLLTGNEDMWWMLAPVRWAGSKIIISYHSVVWPKYAPLKRLARLFIALNRVFILRHAKAILATSNDIRIQVEELLGRDLARVPLLSHLPSYRPEQFATISFPEGPPRRPFRTVFMGRIEANKGIFDIVDIARRLQQERPGEFKFDLCGSGGQLETLRDRVADLGLAGAVAVHGQCGPEQLRALLSASHACIVPTRSDFVAGFEMTCSEAILAGRPLITSAVCPALHYLRPASIEVPPDDVDAYHDAIVSLSDDDALYVKLQSATTPLQDQFYDRANSWYAAMRKAIEQDVLRRADPRT